MKKILLTLLTFIFAIGMVSAETISKNFTIDSYFASSTPVKFPEGFTVKKTSTGKYAFCTHYEKLYPTGQKYTQGKLVSDKGMTYILTKSVKDGIKSDSDFFIYQTALWVYMVDQGIMPGDYSKVTTFKSTLKNSTSASATKIKNLVSEAKKAGANDTTAPSIIVGDTSNVKFTLNNAGTKYVSSKITIKNNTDSYKVTLTSAPEGTTYEKGSNYIIISVPANKVTSLSTNIKFKVSTSKDIYSAYIYNTSNSAYQPMAVAFKETKSDDASGSVTLTKTASATISKQDVATSEEVEGATLVVTDSNGKQVDKWISGTTPHVVKGLSAGTYTLKETIEPDGYVLSEETITFTIDKNGKLVDANGKEASKIVMYNKKETETLISKQDIATSEELPGAKLRLTNKNGKIIDEWTSEAKPHAIKNLPAGTYILKETVQPDGYILSEETITFTIDKNGKLTDANGKEIDKVVMYNEKEPATGGASISKQDITNKEELEGAHLVVKDYDGNVVDEWISTKEPHLIADLKPGIYTLTETLQPDGYILSDETITFTVKEDGSITKVVMYNTPDTKEVVKVENTASSKTIVTTIGGISIILIGAYLIFKNKKLA